MCQKLPRPRCSKHTYDKYAQELAAYEELAQQATHSKKRDLLEKLYQQRQKMEDARRDYNASPEGLSELNAKIEEARKNRARGDLDDYMWQYQVAVADAVEHKLAGKIYDRAGESLRNPQDDASLQRAYKYERLANANLATLMNEGAEPQKIGMAKAMAAQAKQARLQREFIFLQAASGVPSDNKRAVTASQALAMKDASFYTFLPPSEFHKVDEYFPLGAYAKVESVQKDEHGNFVLSLEGGKTKLLPGEKKILAVLKN